MRILVTGGSSFLGAHFCRRAATEHTVFALHHATPLALNAVTPLRVDLSVPRNLARLQAISADVVVHLAARIRGPAGPGETPGAAAGRINDAMMDRVLALGRPVVYLSSPVVAWKVPTAYGASRARDEARLAASGLPYVILRPSAPYGPALRDHQPRHKESFASLVSLVRRFPLVPVPGNGQQRRQPIHCDDLSAAILALLRRPLDGNVYAAGGAQALSMDTIVETIARAAGTRARPLHIPVALLSSLAHLRPELDAELLKASVEDELADPGALEVATGIAPRSFAEGVVDLLR